MMKEIIEDDGRAFIPDKLAGWLDNPGNLAFAAILDGKVVGLIEGYSLQCVDDCGPRYFIYSVGVLPEYRNRKTGARLLTFTLDYTRKNGFSESFVPTDRGNIPACRLYEGRGGKNDYENEVIFVWDYKKK